MATLTDDEIVAQYRRGDISRSALAYEAGCSRTKVDRALAQAGILDVPPHVDDELRRNVVAFYGQGRSLLAVTKAFGLSTHVASLILRKAGVLRRPGRPRGGRHYPDVDVLNLYDDGGIYAIVDRARVSLATAYRLLRDARAAAATVPPVIWEATAPCEYHAAVGCGDCADQT